ncbi:MAG: DNA polymerase III subunit delta' [Deltaproteobacteria bacterium]|nr:DNA polymerase III subunit delta' [Deltaproteobacteria bacterium]MBW2069680.1 DNA polymerase III subunit delta' [Deltaproteobacteria bacterium]
MSFADIFGQQRVIRLLQRGLRNNRLPHSMLFTGQQGVGKRLTAVTLAKVLTCQGGNRLDCCEQCSSCAKVNNNNHPDVLTLNGQKDIIKIGQIRNMQQHLRFRPLEGDWRIVILDHAEQMTMEAANALLKSLEEPPAGNLFILTAPDVTALFPTIVSRCLHLRFQPLSQTVISRYLQESHGVKVEQADEVASLAGGSLSRALNLVNEELSKHRRWLSAAIDNLHGLSYTEVLTVAEKWSKSTPGLRQDLDWLQVRLRDLVVSRLLQADSCQRVTQPESLPTWLLMQFFDMVTALQQGLQYNLNKRLALEALLLSVQSLLKKEDSQVSFSAKGFDLAASSRILRG